MPKPVSRSMDLPPLYIGIDPGASGGLCCLPAKQTPWRPTQAVGMPKTDRDLWNWFREVAEFSWEHKLECYCVIEKVWGHTGSPQPGSRMFNFGVNYGLLRMALTASGIPFEEVVPRTWQKALSIPPRKKTETKTQWKNRLRQKSQQLFPNVGVTLATADAILLAEFCRRKHKGNYDER